MPWTTLLVTLALVSCQSPKGKALGSVDRIFEHASAAQKDVLSVRPFVEQQGVPHLDNLAGHVAAIADEAVNEARPNIERLKNPETWLQRAWGYASKVLIALVSLFALFFLAELKVIPGLGWLVSWLARKGLSFSRTATHEAALAVDMLYKYGDRSVASEQLVSAKRTMSPTFNGAFIRAKEVYRAGEVQSQAERAAQLGL